MRELSLNVMDVAQNSIAADATTVRIGVEENADAQTLCITISDNGHGMTPEQLEQVQSPFFSTRTTRKIGMGVPLFKMACEMTGGHFFIESELEKGTNVRAEFQTDHIDMTPLGNMGETVLLLISCNPEMDFIYAHTIGDQQFVLDTAELRQILGSDVPLNTPAVIQWMQEYLQNGEASLTEA